MKSKFFKTVLPAFSLIVAMAASFAFMLNENTKEDTKYSQGYYHENGACTLVTRINCTNIFNTNGFCSVVVIGITKRVYGKNSSSVCGNITLYKCL